MLYIYYYLVLKQNNLSWGILFLCGFCRTNYIFESVIGGLPILISFIQTLTNGLYKLSCVYLFHGILCLLMTLLPFIVWLFFIKS